MVANQPNFTVKFLELAVSAIKRNARGRVVIVLDDSTLGFPDKQAFKTFGDVPKAKMTARNYLLVQLAFEGNPREVILVKKEAEFSNIQTKLLDFNNYILVYPSAAALDHTAIKSFLTAQKKKNDYSTAILGNATAPDLSYIVNLCTPSTEDTFDCKMGEEELTKFTAGEFTCFVAGALAGLPSSRSLTYYKIPMLVNVPLFADEDEAVAQGKLIVLKVDGQYKLGRAVNSLTTLTDGVTEAFQKIRIADIMDMIANDFVTTFRTSWVGNYTNTYANKIRLCGAMNSYLAQLEFDGLLNKRLTDDSGTFDYDKYKTQVSYSKNRLYLQGKGVDVSSMTVDEILRADTGSKVLLDSTASPVDTMEDLDLTVYLYQALNVA